MSETELRLNATDVPRIPRGVRLHQDKVRDKTVLLAPERVIDLDPIGQAILQQIDGTRDMAAIIGTLASLYDAPEDQISGDVHGYVRGLMDRRILELTS